MRFIDETILKVKSGDGGYGAVAFRRERFRPRGGPAGGDGGKGGDVVFEADGGLGTLLDLRHRPQLVAQRGEHGKGSDCHGKAAESLVIRVPVGTVVYDVATEEMVGDLVRHGQRLIVANGGLYPGDLQTTAVYRPAECPGNYLDVRLTGTASNRDAIGARIMLQANGRQQHRLVSGGSNFGCSPLEQHFGLADAVHVDLLEIRWPSGLTQQIVDVPVNTTINVEEGSSVANGCIV